MFDGNLALWMRVHDAPDSVEDKSTAWASGWQWMRMIVEREVFLGRIVDEESVDRFIRIVQPALRFQTDSNQGASAFIRYLQLEATRLAELDRAGQVVLARLLRAAENGRRSPRRGQVAK